MLHAVGITLVRLGMARGRLLEWETAAAWAHRARHPSARTFYAGMMASPVVAVGGALLVALVRPAALPAASGILVALGGRAAHRVCIEPADCGAACAARRRRSRVPSYGRAQDVELLRHVHARPWRTACRPTTCRWTPGVRIAARTSPTNIGMGLLATLAAHDFGFIDTDGLIAQTRSHVHVGGTARAVRRPPPELVRHAEPRGASAGVRLDRRQRESRGRSPDALGRSASPRDGPAGAGTALRAERGARGAGGPCRRTVHRHGLPAVLRRAATALRDRLPARGRRERGTSRRRPTTTCWRRSRGWRASSPSPRATCQSMHWFHLGRLVTSVRGAPVLLSWSATLFEYLMPLLVMRSYPGTLLDVSCRMAVRRQIDYAATRGTPVGHLRVGLHVRGPARHLPIQGVRRARPRAEARAWRRAGRGAVCDGAGRDARSGGERRQPAAAVAGGAVRRARILRRGGLHGARGRSRPARAARA